MGESGCVDDNGTVHSGPPPSYPPPERVDPTTRVAWLALTIEALYVDWYW